MAARCASEAQAAAGFDPFQFNIFETTQSDPAFAATLKIHAGYGKLNITAAPGLTLDAGVRYEDAVQTVDPVEVFATPLGSASSTLIANDYFLPAGTLTYEITPDLQARISASATIARPQFRELIFQTYFDPETNRQFNGNPRLIDSELTNYEARLEYYLGGGDRISLAGFYKDIENPIEVFSSFSDNDQISGFANRADSVHLTLFPETPDGWRDDKLAARWEKIFKVRRVVTGALNSLACCLAYVADVTSPQNRATAFG